MMKTLIVVFGEMGCGKSTFAKLLSEHLKISYFEGDDILLSNECAKIKEKVIQKKMMTMEEIDQFVLCLINRIENILQQENSLVVSQALYLTKHRKLICDKLSQIAKIKFIQVKSPVWKQCEQIKLRSGWGWVWYAIKNKLFFQPDDASYVIKNNGSIDELKNFVSKIEFNNSD